MGNIDMLALRRRWPLAMLCLILIGTLITGMTLGWFKSSFERTADTGHLTVDDPPILYILDSNAEDFTQLDLKDLEIGTEKQIVFCVSSVYPANEPAIYSGSFSLQLAYTENLKASFDLYAASQASSTDENTIVMYSQGGTALYFTRGAALEDTEIFTDVSVAGNEASYGTGYAAAQNQVCYKSYTSQTDSNVLWFGEPDGNGGRRIVGQRYFVLDITWQNGKPTDVDSKETDLIYILAKGGSTTS